MHEVDRFVSSINPSITRRRRLAKAVGRRANQRQSAITLTSDLSRASILRTVD